MNSYANDCDGRCRIAVIVAGHHPGERPFDASVHHLADLLLVHMGSGTPVVIADTIERLADEIPPLSGDGVSVVIDARGIGAAGVHPVEDVGAPGRILGFALIEGLGVDGAAVVWNSGGPSRQARSGPALTAHRSERGWVRLHPRWSVDENDPAGTITVPVPLHQDPVRLFPG